MLLRQPGSLSSLTFAQLLCGLLYRDGSTENRYCGPYSRNFIIQAASFKCLQGPGSEHD